MDEGITVRRASDEDMAAAYAVFRLSIYDYLFRAGFVDAAAAKDPPVESAWKRQGGWIRHLWASAAENWVAVQADRVIGWAMSVERDGHLELAMFFVAPGVQGGGIGRALIRRAFPEGAGRSGRSIVATQDARALGLYFRSGVQFRTTAVDVLLRAGPVAGNSDLGFERLGADAAGCEAIGLLDRAVLGFRRDLDVAHLLAGRPAWLARRDGRAVGYAFGIQPNPPGADDYEPACGPIAALDPADMPALVDQVIGAGAAGQSFCITVPMANQAAMDHLLRNRGGRIDPFYLMILGNTDEQRFDRFIHTSPSFIL